MLMVVIGAGASFDSSADHPATSTPFEADRPPLANDLFLDVPGVRRSARSQFTELYELIPELLPRKGASLEDSLQRIQNESKGDPYRLQQLVAVRYYLRTLLSNIVPRWLSEIGHVTNYWALLGQLAHHRRADDPEPICLVTFNYDTMIEHSLEKRFGMAFNVIADYVSNPTFKLFKLHGSVDWGRYINTGMGSWVNTNTAPWARPEEVISQIARLSISDSYVVAEKQPHQGPPLFPAIAIPVSEKSTFECPRSHLGELERLIPKVTKILTIGWRGAEKHFLDMLSKGLANSRGVKIVTVAGTPSDAQATAAIMQALHFPVAIVGSFAGFSASLAERRFDLMLSA